MPGRESWHSLFSEQLVRNNVGLPKSGRGRLGSGGLLRGTLAMADVGLLPAARNKSRRGPAHLRSCGANLQRVKGFHHAQANDSVRPGALLRGGQAKRPKQVGQLSYAAVAREGIWVAVVCENYP